MGLDQYFYVIHSSEREYLHHFRKQHKLEDFMCSLQGGSEEDQFGGIIFELDLYTLECLEEKKRLLVDVEEYDNFTQSLMECRLKLKTYRVFYASSW